MDVVVEQCTFCGDAVDVNSTDVKYLNIANSRIAMHVTCLDERVQHVRKHSRVPCFFCGGLVDTISIGSDHEYGHSHDDCHAEMKIRMANNVCIACGDDSAVVTKSDKCAYCNLKYVGYPYANDEMNTMLT